MKETALIEELLEMSKTSLYYKYFYRFINDKKVIKACNFPSVDKKYDDKHLKYILDNFNYIFENINNFFEKGENFTLEFILNSYFDTPHEIKNFIVNPYRHYSPNFNIYFEQSLLNNLFFSLKKVSIVYSISYGDYSNLNNFKYLDYVKMNKIAKLILSHLSNISVITLFNIYKRTGKSIIKDDKLLEKIDKLFLELSSIPNVIIKKQFIQKEYVELVKDFLSRLKKNDFSFKGFKINDITTYDPTLDNIILLATINMKYKSRNYLIKIGQKDFKLFSYIYLYKDKKKVYLKKERIFCTIDFDRIFYIIKYS